MGEGLEIRTSIGHYQVKGEPYNVYKSHVETKRTTSASAAEEKLKRGKNTVMTI